MFDVKQLDKQIIEIYYKGEVSYDTWVSYQDRLLEELDKVDHKLYILSNFSDITLFDPKIAKEVGTAKHLTHPNLGLIVLLGGNVLMNFILQLTANRAQKEEKSTRVRIHKDYKRALEALTHQRNIENNPS